MDNPGFAGDPFHEGTEKPQLHLQGDMAGIHTQMPLESSNQDNPRSAGEADTGPGWANTTFAPKATPTGANANPVH
ncbi:hypothetical protein [Streptomyces sp. URMC 129]|uniref:hypothetical protein n=1 Tax=Streptomyces sp. URMC 129 TaxID=3423407 RepID=UPI003F1AF186